MTGQLADGSATVPYANQDWFCKQGFTARRDFQAVMFETTPMIVGGYLGLNQQYADVWIRGLCARCTTAHVFVCRRESAQKFTEHCGIPPCSLPDAKIPITFITNKPKDHSSDTSIEFTCDELVCLFEYQLLDSAGEVNRNWSLVSSPLNFKQWMKSGQHTFQVRTRGLCQ